MDCPITDTFQGPSARQVHRGGSGRSVVAISQLAMPPPGGKVDNASAFQPLNTKTLSEELLDFVTQQENDLEIYFKGERFTANRLVLASRSKVRYMRPWIFHPGVKMAEVAMQGDEARACEGRSFRRTQSPGKVRAQRRTGSCGTLPSGGAVAAESGSGGVRARVSICLFCISCCAWAPSLSRDHRLSVLGECISAAVPTAQVFCAMLNGQFQEGAGGCKGNYGSCPRKRSLALEEKEPDVASRPRDAIDLSETTGLSAVALRNLLQYMHTDS